MRPRAASMVISRPGPMYQGGKRAPIPTPIQRAPSADAGGDGKLGIRRNVGRRGTMAVGAMTQAKSTAKTAIKDRSSTKAAIWGLGLEGGFVGAMDHFTVQVQ